MMKNIVLRILVLPLLCVVSLSYSQDAELVRAPGRGVIPMVSNHYKTMPTLYDFDQMPAEHIAKGISRRFIMGTQSSMIRWDLAAGTKLPPNVPHEFVAATDVIIYEHHTPARQDFINGDFEKMSGKISSNKNGSE